MLQFLNTLIIAKYKNAKLRIYAVRRKYTALENITLGMKILAIGKQNLTNLFLLLPPDFLLENVLIGVIGKILPLFV